MSQEGGSERTQRTVAELLAKYGGSPGDGAPRRRRRKPDDASETAPQAIIDRVMSDSGKLLPIREDQPPHERASHRQDRGPAAPPPQAPPPAQQAPQLPRRTRPDQPQARVDQQPPTQQHPPVAPPRREPQVDPRQAARPVVEPRLPEPPRQPQRPDDPRPPQGRPDQGRPDQGRPEQPEQRHPQAPPPPHPRPVDPREQHGPQAAARPRPDAAEPLTEQLPRVPADDQLPDPGEPPAGLGKAPNRAPLPRRAPSGARRPPQVSQPLPVPPQASQPLPVPQVSQPLPVPPRQPGYREFAGDSAETAVDPTGPPPEFREEFTGFDDKAATRFTGYSAHDEFADRLDDDLDDRFDKDRFDQDLDDRFDEDDEPDRARDDLDDDEDEPDAEAEPRSAGREWLIMVGQLGLGVVGGAVVWLIFNWLWRVLPAAALVGALAVIVGLVLIVRKVRRAEDLQTTVLAVLVGLLATVSPAALLLLGR